MEMWCFGSSSLPREETWHGWFRHIIEGTFTCRDVDQLSEATRGEGWLPTFLHPVWPSTWPLECRQQYVCPSWSLASEGYFRHWCHALATDKALASVRDQTFDHKQGAVGYYLDPVRYQGLLLRTPIQRSGTKDGPACQLDSRYERTDRVVIGPEGETGPPSQSDQALPKK